MPAGIPRRPSPAVRARRAVLGLVVVVLLVAVIEVAGGPVRDVRNGASAVLGPVGHGIGQAVTPFKNLVGWVGDTASSKGQVGKVRRDRDAARAEAIRGAAAASENPQLRGLATMDRQPVDLTPYRPVTARVLVRSPTLWYTKIVIGKGSDDGIHADRAVIAADGAGANDGGLIGKVESVTPTSAVVRLLTNSTVAVGVKTAAGNAAGTLVTNPGNPKDLELDSVPANAALEQGTVLVTQGTTSTRHDLPSVYPPDLQIGRVSRIDAEGTLQQEFHVQAFVDARAVDYVQVLTRSVDGNR